MCVFSKRRYEEWKYILLRGKNDFVLELVVSGCKNKRHTNMNTENCRFVARDAWKRSFVPGQSQITLHLIRLMCFIIKIRLVQDWIWFLSLLREQNFLGILLVVTDHVRVFFVLFCFVFCLFVCLFVFCLFVLFSFFFAFKWSVFVFWNILSLWLNE